MKITTKAVYDIDGNLLEWEGYEYEGPVAECKGGASKSEQTAADAMRQQMFNLQQQQLQSVNATVDPMIAAGGLDPRVEAAMRTQAMNQTGQSYINSIGNVNQNLVARGIFGGTGGAGGGAAASEFGKFNYMQNALQSSLMTNIEMQKQQALMNELGLKMGIGGQAGASASNALNAGVTAAKNVDQASTGLWGGILGGALGLGTKFIPGMGLASAVSGARSAPQPGFNDPGFGGFNN